VDAGEYPIDGSVAGGEIGAANNRDDANRTRGYTADAVAARDG